MGNTGSSGNNRRNRNQHNHNQNHPIQTQQNQQHPQPPQPEMTGNRYVFAAASPYPSLYPNQNPNLIPPQQHHHNQQQQQQPYYQYSGYYPAPPPTMPLPNPYHGPHMDPTHGNWVNGRYPCAPMPQNPTPYVEHQKAVTIRNDVNLKKETLRVEPDEENPGKFLIGFTFDATVAGSITVVFFAKEGLDCNLTPMKEGLQPVTMSFQQGLGQKFRQPAGTGIDFSALEETELMKEGDLEVFPLAVKAEASPPEQNGLEGENPAPGAVTSQITQAVFEKEKGEYKVRVVKQILSVNGMRYELQEIYGIGNSVDSDVDGNDPGKECVICLSEPRDTTVLPCRHMCMCSGCAKVLRFQTNRCPICRQPVDRLLEIKVNNRSDE
ncbi:hypothetical protein MKW94_015890 [Papaver nudicaule]|uniref:RING-type E3 ubiquitin transferase n=1 Tax=Papaver nudicaule TaxID=74823 RepID=A0AA41W0W3_PAPNU|nr:hypothetical protein [Papaver nudicaule]